MNERKQSTICYPRWVAKGATRKALLGRGRRITDERWLPLGTNQKRVQMFKEPDGVLRYKPISADEAAKFRGLAREDMVVYQLIKQSGSKGIWTKDLKQQSNLSQPQITKTLKTLENKVLIKSVRSVTNKNRKVYMLYELEPSKEITGGNWYTNQQFDDEFINVLSENCLRYIRNQGFATVEEVHEFLRKIRIANVSRGEMREEKRKKENIASCANPAL